MANYEPFGTVTDTTSVFRMCEYSIGMYVNPSAFQKFPQAKALVFRSNDFHDDLASNAARHYHAN